MEDKKIPKNIHYCWFGKNPESELMKKCISSWKIFFPENEYKFYLWNEDTFDITSNKFVKEAFENKKWAFITDYVRLWALYNYGGIYLDTDVEVLKSLEKFLSHNAFSGFEDEQYIPTGLMGAHKENEWIKKLLDYYKNKSFLKKDGSFEMTPNTKIITDITKEYYNLTLNNKKQDIGNNILIYPKDYFCPKNHYDERIRLTENTHTIHHFNGSWKTRKDKIKQKMHKIFIIIFGEKIHQKILKKIKGIN